MWHRQDSEPLLFLDEIALIKCPDIDWYEYIKGIFEKRGVDTSNFIYAIQTKPSPDYLRRKDEQG